MSRVPPRVVLRAWSAYPGVVARLRELTGVPGNSEPSLSDGGEPGPLDIVISLTVGDPAGRAHHEASAAFARERHAPWLHMACDEDGTLTLGPLFAGESSVPCFACFKETRKAYPRGGHTGPLEEGMLRVAVGLAGLEIERCALRYDKPEMSRVRVYNLATQAMGYCLVARTPGCPDCWPWEHGHEEARGHELSVAALFEECVREGRLGAGTKNALTAARKEKTYDHCAKVQLTPWRSLYEAARGQPAEDAHRPDTSKPGLTDLANLLGLVFGRFKRGDGIRAHRSLPSAGGLGSVEAYLIARRVEGLADGVYYYERAGHRLAALETPAKPTLADVLGTCHLEPAGDGRGAWLVMVGAYGRISAKYGAFGFRLVHFDTGIAVEELSEVAASLGLNTVELASFDEELLTQALLLRPFEELIMSVTFIRGAGVLSLFEGKDKAPGEACHETLPDSAPLPVRTDVTPKALARVLWEQSRAVEKTGERANPPWALPQTEAPRKPLPALWEHAAGRVSKRVFAARPVSLLVAERMLALARCQVPGPCRGSRLALHASLLHGDRESRTCTLLSHFSERGRFGVQTGVVDEEEVWSMFSDRSFAALPPITVWICGDIHCSPELYRRMLVDAGRLVMRVIHAAESLDLGGVVYAGIQPRAVSRVLGLRSVNDTAILAFAAGYQAGSPIAEDGPNKDGEQPWNAEQSG